MHPPTTRSDLRQLARDASDCGEMRLSMGAALVCCTVASWVAVIALVALVWGAL